MGKWFVYILQSAKDRRFYIGSTSDIEKRLAKHNAGGVDATKYRRPLALVYKEELPYKITAMTRERQLKSLKSHKAIQALVDNGRASR
ncbi:MAG: GIY-YIG nuclease family protein [Candidatus Edwardsbacteria bacterium]|nr:GIY-YIG nuclease family protein [Candidatus Edwardsbacteria bacterium]MBU1577010.1 GIY-YIG nuclease family protein [Candidatus Edwardsbacteria bacterium]MBU2464504.1 GIY-YIG nuclease family protein [Candidatus Edwardsbacteria bacterium]MBU2594813.1 GIY-YIG nuclease family protein [Candidatus Edwardsbacteria bacterium]